MSDNTEGLLTKGKVYSLDRLGAYGWHGVSEGDDTSGYNAWNYFDDTGRYLGPDEDGVQPLIDEFDYMLIDCINADAGYDYIKDRDEARDEIAVTNDTIEDFKKVQEHIETRATEYGALELFRIGESSTLYVLDGGVRRFCLLYD